MNNVIQFPNNRAVIRGTTPYTVFIDESFDGFLGLSNPKGYFCYAALMVPTERLSALDTFWAALRDRLIEDYKRSTGFDMGTNEFKSGYLNKLAFVARKEMGERLKYFLTKNKCFIGGFYTTVDNFTLYHLRNDIAFEESTAALPPDWGNRLAPMKEKLLRGDEKTPGVAGLLSGLLHTTLEISLNWLGHQGISFEVVYDPRQKKEDAYLLKSAGAWLRDEKAAFQRFPGIFLGANAKVKSCDSPGLMLTDLILRDLRFMFFDLPGLLEEASSPELVLPVPQKDEPLIMSIKGTRLKAGNIRRMSPDLTKGLKKPTSNSMMPLYLDRLADVKISCHAKWGEVRTADFRDWTFADMVD